MAKGTVRGWRNADGESKAQLLAEAKVALRDYVVCCKADASHDGCFKVKKVKFTIIVEDDKEQ